MRRIVFTGIMLSAIVLVQGCTEVATSVPQVVYNRHSLKKTINDQLITMQANQALNYKTDEFKDANITLATCNGDVLLAGQVPSSWQKFKAEQIVKSIPDVKQVYNLVTISSPSSTLTKLSDAWLTTKVKSKLIASEDVDGSQVKVVTENGTVYLMGILPPQEADAAVEVASNTDGVVSVVKMFSYMRITKT